MTLSKEDIDHIQSSYKLAADKSKMLQILLQQFPDNVMQVCSELGLLKPTTGDERINDAMEMLLLGKTITYVKQHFGLDTETMREWVWDYGMDLGLRTIAPKRARVEVVQQFWDGANIEELAQKYHIGVESIRRWAKEEPLPPCNMDCEHCTRPPAKCHGGDDSTAYTDKCQQPIRHGAENHEKNLPMYHLKGRRVYK